MTIDLTKMQRDAIDRAAAWFRSDGDQVFRIFGFAGTGKTTIARALAAALAEDDKLDTHYAAYTGKAALVMRRAGCEGATTIHSALYSAVIDEETGRVTYSLNEAGPLSDADLIVIDECSMVGDEIGRDLLSFEKKFLILGDPAQLPPVKDGGFFTEGTPDVMLTEIHRQAEGNPIIQLASAAREGRTIPLGAFGNCHVIKQSEANKDRVLARMLAADQTLCGTNVGRAHNNSRIRAAHGRAKPTPVKGDRVVCRKNDKSKGIFNGETFVVSGIEKSFTADKVRFIAQSTETGREVRATTMVKCFTEGIGALREYPWQMIRDTDQFEFAEALTVHLAQGSQWDDVVLFDESGVFRADARRWLYTGITRAASRILIVR